MKDVVDARVLLGDGRLLLSPLISGVTREAFQLSVGQAAREPGRRRGAGQEDPRPGVRRHPSSKRLQARVLSLVRPELTGQEAKSQEALHVLATKDKTRCLGRKVLD